jgi:hypothetical protein
MCYLLYLRSDHAGTLLIIVPLALPGAAGSFGA